ncbi:MAG: NAD(P)/FAD-dependent oxidoreductase [Gemmatimonadaceae bacterium]|nr:NAD(P)/FAD-dependent oxidoreductase [Gemmatimonadaceae bacterium]
MQPTTRHIVILGGGTAGTIMANRLARHYAGDIKSGEIDITVVDENDVHVYQPGLLFLPFGMYDADDIVKPRGKQLPSSAHYLQARIAQVDSAQSRVLLENGTALPYDVLIIATGTRTAPEETEGMTGPGWQEKVFDWYTLEGSRALAKALSTFEGGNLVISITDMPIKCPVAPLEFAFLADWYLQERGIRDKVTISYVTPLDAAFTKKAAAAALAHLLEEKGIQLVTEFATGSIDGAAGKLVSFDEREVPFDLLAVVPVHAGAEFLTKTPGLANAMGFVKTDPATLQSQHQPNIFALGDATDVPASKAGSVAHFEAEVLEQNVIRFLDGKPFTDTFDGHANCFIETGFHKALLIDFNYDTDPVSGHFPFSVGPLTLLKESRLNHLGKMAFKYVYWHALLPGYDLPGVPTHMSLSGKDL